MVGGNWKCNGTMAFAKSHTTDVLNKMKFDPKKVDVVVAPTALHIPAVQAVVANNVHVATQNLSLTGNGAFTGEFSVDMLKDAGITHTLTGHSESRTLYGETDKDVGLKTKIAVDAGIVTLACIGELLDERESGKTKEVNTRQLNAIREHCDDWSKIVIAYEPVWAIGTGKVATPEQAEETHLAIREWLAKNVPDEVAGATRILYGGSVNAGNCDELIKKPNIDGFLVGGASLKEDFKTIIETVAGSV